MHTHTFMYTKTHTDICAFERILKTLLLFTLVGRLLPLLRLRFFPPLVLNANEQGKRNASFDITQHAHSHIHVHTSMYCTSTIIIIIIIAITYIERALTPGCDGAPCCRSLLSSFLRVQLLQLERHGYEPWVRSNRSDHSLESFTGDCKPDDLLLAFDSYTAVVLFVEFQSKARIWFESIPTFSDGGCCSETKVNQKETGAPE